MPRGQIKVPGGAINQRKCIRCSRFMTKAESYFGELLCRCCQARDRLMTLDEAIKENQGLLRSGLKVLTQREKEALKLGIEALKRVKKERTGYERYAPDLLPGETEE